MAKVNFINKSFIFQVVFWLGFWIINFIDEIVNTEDDHAILVVTVYVLSIMTAVYINILWIIPKFLYNKRYVSYIVALMFSSTVMLLLFDLIGLAVEQNSLLELMEGDPFLFIGLIQDLIMVGGISSVWIIVEQLKTKERLIVAEKKQTETSLKFLKAQTNPHFLFNVLNNVHFLIERDPSKASQTLIKLSDILRYQLYETDEDSVYIEKEIENIKNYIELEQIRMGDRLVLNTHFDCSNPKLKIEPFLLMPLVENAFKHSSSTEPSIISIDLKVNQSTLDFKIENSLPGKVKKSKGNGLGIVNLEERLKLLYPKNHEYMYGEENEKYVSHLKLSV